MLSLPPDLHLDCRALWSQLTILVKDLAHDAAANSVRIAVLAGLKYLLVQNGSPTVIAVLKTLLTPLASLLNDGSERVRTSLVDLLLALAKIRTIVWQTYVKPEALLARLPHERPDMQMRLTRLLVCTSHNGRAPQRHLRTDARRIVTRTRPHTPARRTPHCPARSLF